MHSHKALLAIFGVFFFESSVLGQWIPRIPDIKSALNLTDGTLGIAMLMMPLGTLFGFSIAGRVIEQTGLRNACRLFLPAWALLFVGPALAQSLVQLCIAMVLSGLAVGMTETAMNTEAARLENVAGKRLMSRCHGFWSLGTMFGALIGGALAQAGYSVVEHFLVVMPVIALCGYAAATALPILGKGADPAVAVLSTAVVRDEATARLDEPVDSTAVEINPATDIFRLPSRAIVLLCLMPIGIMMVEGAFIDWSAVFMRDVLAAGPWVIAVTYSSFSLIMASVRLAGDTITTNFGEMTVVRVSGLASCAGVALFALSPSIPWAFLGAALSGAGVAIVFPLAVSAAANRPGRCAADNVAALNMISFSAFLVAPPVIGFMSEAFGLRIALLGLAPIAFLTFLLSSEVSGQRHQISIR
ncbi:MAG: MFS transporter [Granulosicoccus sp.]|nr:MFS transporter [Granulosicoccus sp.]